MGKRGFSENERAAVYKAHKGVCHLCRHGCSLDDMQVDHVIPESLANFPEKLAETLTLFGLPLDFDLNSFENWAPSHSKCNNEKSDTIFLSSPMAALMIQKARRLGSKARMLAATDASKAVVARAKSDLRRAAERGLLTEDEAQEFSLELTRIVTETRFKFIAAVAVNALELKPNFVQQFNADGIHFSVRTYLDDGVPEPHVTASARVTAKLFNLEMEVAVRFEAFGGKRPTFFFDVRNVTFPKSMSFIEGLLKHAGKNQLSIDYDPKQKD